jgi:RNA-directed DNA polymerase
MQTRDRFLALQNLYRVQRQAGVSNDVAELVCAYGRLRVETGDPLTFDLAPFAQDSAERAALAHLRARNPDRDERFLRFLAAYAAAFTRRQLPVLYDAAALCRILEVGQGELRGILARAGDCYRAFEIPKSDGRMRRIFAPQGRLRDLQYAVLRQLLERCKPHDCATGFLRGTSIVDNARAHVGKAVVVRIDLEDFFPSITRRDVRDVFCALGYPFSVAHLLAGICTLDGRLPQGAPTSPALSNLVAITLDRRFVGLSARLHFSYTRYADDLIFSSSNADLPRLIPFFRQVVQEEGFRVNERKIRVMRRGNRQRVTGITTNEKLSLPRKHVRKLRAALHRLRTRGPESVEWPSTQLGDGRALQILQGHLAFLRMVDPDRAAAVEGLSSRRADSRQPLPT